MKQSDRNIISILSTINEGLDFIKSNGLENKEYLFDSILEGIKFCNEYTNINKKDYSEFLDLVILLKKEPRLENLEKFEKELDLWEEKILNKLLITTQEKTDNTYDNSIVTINTDLLETPIEGEDLYQSRLNIAGLLGGESVPLVSIVVIAFNRLQKTKNCVESILKYTNSSDYELILVDNGSSDETINYFTNISFKNKKIIKITKNLQMSFATVKGVALCQGRFISILANDLIMTKDWLKNILLCFESDKKIGMVCTMSSNISNLQDAQLTFNSFEEMQERAAQYNVSDCKKWHERLRLITVGTVFRRECLDICGNFDYGFYHDFIDDDITFQIRRAGYKTVLCKDVFIYHDHPFGSDKNTGELEKSLEKGRNDFKTKYYGIDAWDDVNNYETTMINLVEKPKHKKNIKILGIDVKCGTPILELKNKIKEFNIFNAQLSSFSQDAKYMADLKTICEGDVICDRIEYMNEYFKNDKFDYILLGEEINLYMNMKQLLERTYDLLQDNGQLLVKLKNIADIHKYLYMTANKLYSPDKSAIDITIDCFIDLLSKIGYKKINVKMDCYSIDELTFNSLKSLLQNSMRSNNIEKEMNKLITNQFVISAIK